MNINPFATVNDYPSMLDKIGWFNFFFTLLVVTTLTNSINEFDLALSSFPSIPFQTPFFSIKINIMSIIISIVLAIMCRVIKLHNLISNIFKIRTFFDFEKILIPMALFTTGNFSFSKYKSIYENRKDIMTRVFYKYVSSGDSELRIDKHYITLALDSWCWYWILIELSTIAFSGSIILIVYSTFDIASLFLLIILVFIYFQGIVYIKNSEYALEEIKQILLDEKRKKEITEVFNAL